MGAVGGSRHYPAGGLGSEAGWHCPSCGAENGGPISQGCTLCGAGRPGRYIGDAPPPPPAAPTTPPAAEARGDLADAWAAEHTEVSVAEAFRAGYFAGVRATLEAQASRQQPAAERDLPPEGIMNRTIIAALELFRDQVLAGAPEEIASGEWMSVAQVNDLLRQLRAHEAEHAHA